MEISKLMCTLKGVVLPKWLLDEDVSTVIHKHQRIWKKILHHFVPLLRESLLQQQINIIFYSIISLFFRHGGFLGCVRAIFLKRDTIKTQLSILKLHRGHALKNDQEQPALMPLIQIL
jgi:hypothetical protein